MRVLVVSLLIGGHCLAGCAISPSVHGNERGGMMEWFATNEAQAFAAAEAHCKRYGKAARITEIKAHTGGHVLFECT